MCAWACASMCARARARAVVGKHMSGATTDVVDEAREKGWHLAIADTVNFDNMFDGKKRNTEGARGWGPGSTKVPACPQPAQPSACSTLAGSAAAARIGRHGFALGIATEHVSFDVVRSSSSNLATSKSAGV